MRPLTYYVAASVDGYIAGPEGEYDMFPFEGDLAAAIMAELPETLPVHARGPLGLEGVPAKRFDTVVMGRGTYEPGLAAGLTSPYSHLEQHVVSRTLADRDTPLDSEVRYTGTDPLGLVRDLKRRDGLGIWLAGGGVLAAAVRSEIDELIVKRSPVVLGAGVPLFAGDFERTRFTRVASRSFDCGVTMETYAAA